MAETFDARRFIADFTSSMNAKDPEKLLRHYTENAEIKDPSLLRPIRGKTEVKKNFEQWSSAFSELEMNVKDVIQAGNKIAIVLDAKARHTGELEVAPGEKVPATNRSIRLDMAEFLTVENDGKVSKDHIYFDMASMMMQLGLMPSGQGTGPSKMKAGAQPGITGR